VKALVNFEESIRSPETRVTYRKYLKHFLDFAKIDADSFVKLGNSEIEEKVMAYVVKLKRRIEAGDLSPNSINVIISPIQLFLVQNDVILNWKKIKRMFPRRKKPQNELPYTTEDIQKMLISTTSLRDKAFIHILASTGCRLGAIKDLQVKHLKEIEDCCAVTIYENDLEEYVGFLTPESYRMLKEYFDHRREFGEVITKESPLITGAGHSAGKNVSPKAFQIIMHKILKNSRLRSSLANSKMRHHKAQNHAFRKRFNTILKMNNSVNHNIAEKLMGHKNGLDGVYLKPTLEQLFVEFKKVIPELTIDESERLRLQNRIKDEKIKKTESEKNARISSLEKKMSTIEKLLRQIDKSDPHNANQQ